MRRADVALYEAKNAGRNCVKLWTREMARLVNAGDIEIERIKKLQRRIMGLSEKAEKLFMESIWSLVQALEAKDTYARKHSENVMAYAVGIARTMELGPKYVDLIHRSAMIHDIGKIGIPDAILFKPDHLDRPRAADHRAASADRRADSREDELPGERDRHRPAPS